MIKRAFLAVKNGGVTEWLKVLAWKASVENNHRRFESCLLRQFSLLPETAKCGVSLCDTECQERATRQGFFKSTASVRSAMWKFEPIFLRKSRPCSGFSCKAIFSAWLVAFRKYIKGSNRLSLFCFEAVKFSEMSIF